LPWRVSFFAILSKDDAIFYHIFSRSSSILMGWVCKPLPGGGGGVGGREGSRDSSSRME